MAHDMKESVMLVANRNVNEYDSLIKSSVEDFLIRYKIYVDEIEIKIQK